ncbi:MAG: hypothetical protein WCV85_02680 [Patescibacteria group bacterium]
MRSNSLLFVAVLAFMASVAFVLGGCSDKGISTQEHSVHQIEADLIVDANNSQIVQLEAYRNRLSEIAIPSLDVFAQIADSIIDGKVISDTILIRDKIWEALRACGKGNASTPTATSYSISNLTSQEFWLLMANPWNANATNTARNLALSAAQNVWPGSQYQTKADAFRHAYWNILMSKYVSISWAQQVATAHESESPNTVDKAMDLDNNAVGRRLYSQYSWYSESDFVYMLRYYTYVKVSSIPAYTWYLVYLA